MNPYVKNLLLVVSVAAILAPATAMAQKSAGGVVGEARLHPGTWSTGRSARSSMRYRPMYRSTAPVIVRSERAPIATAQTPTERRSFSYEPSQESQQSDSGAEVQGPAGTQRSTENRRSFSYEPSMNNGSSAGPRYYSAPRMGSSRTSRESWFLRPKMERNNYRN